MDTKELVSAIETELQKQVSRFGCAAHKTIPRDAHLSHGLDGQARMRSDGQADSSFVGFVVYIFLWRKLATCVTMPPQLSWFTTASAGA
ncbi:MAG: hypothetical protein U0V48_12695 [Anaerolineales bacterium]